MYAANIKYNRQGKLKPNTKQDVIKKKKKDRYMFKLKITQFSYNPNLTLNALSRWVQQ